MSKKKKKDKSNKFGAFETNPIVQPDEVSEMNVPIPSEQNVENARDYSEKHKM